MFHLWLEQKCVCWPCWLCGDGCSFCSFCWQQQYLRFWEETFSWIFKSVFTRSFYVSIIVVINSFFVVSSFYWKSLFCSKFWIVFSCLLLLLEVQDLYLQGGCLFCHRVLIFHSQDNLLCQVLYLGSSFKINFVFLMIFAVVIGVSISHFICGNVSSNCLSVNSLFVSKHCRWFSVPESRETSLSVDRKGKHFLSWSFCSQ